MNTVIPKVVESNGRRYGRVVPTTAITVTVSEDAELAALALRAEKNRKQRVESQRQKKNLQEMMKETKRFNRRRKCCKAMDRLITVGLLASGLVCFHLLPWWSCIAPAVGAAWLGWRAAK